MGAALFVALGEVVALEQARHGVLGAETDHVLEAQTVEPIAVEANLGFFRVENLEDLGLVGGGVGQDFFPRERRPGDVAAGGVADAGGAVAHDEDHVVAHVLEVLHLAEEHGVAQVQVGRGGIEADLDFQRPADADARLELFLADELDEALLEIRDLFFQGVPAHLTIVASGIFAGSMLSPGAAAPLPASSPRSTRRLRTPPSGSDT